ncbi:molybdenum cofactor biosynthesis protein MoaE [Saxibacter everestensis]|uniref:Molybdenum cofactor biosynthesis protein MoaE n=1 Tax=Saxibacter everestensis TaxID=2909229 RepID=A0ABY8QUF1_9MICO|nr:molybdenum cofactor biosynthesis protein MoaE [Brevibacteriaceae bacterium ZFBP1038]
MRDESRLSSPGRSVRRAVVTADPIVPQELQDLVAMDAAGAVVGFSGIVRNHDRSRPVTGLDYEAHPDADRTVKQLVNEIVAAHAVDAVAVAHRTGQLRIGDVAFGVAVSAAHRHEAFAACEEIVETVKRELPIWKHQTFEDGSAEWVGSA